MKAINLKQLATFSFAALLLASCSDSNNEAGNADSGAAKTSVVGKEVTSITDAQTLAARVYNFKTTTSTSTRAGGAITPDQPVELSMPEKPSKEGAIELTADNSCQGLQYGKTYIIKSGATINSGVQLNGATLIVEGTLNTNNFWNCGAWDGTLNKTVFGKIAVLSGGTLNLTNNDNGFAKSADVNIYNYGGTVTSNLWNIYNTSYYTTGDLKTDATVNVQSNLYVGGKIEAGNFTVPQGGVVTANSVKSKNDLKVQGSLNVKESLDAKTFTVPSDGVVAANSVKSDNKLEVQGSLDVKESLNVPSFVSEKGARVNIQGDVDWSKEEITIDGTVNFGGKFIAKNIEVISDGNLYACSIEAKEKFSINSNTAKAHVNYLKAKDIYQCASSYLYLVNNSVIECDTYENENNGSGTILLEGDYAKAYFKAGTIKFNGSNDYVLPNTTDKKYSTCYIFNANGTGSYIYLSFNGIYNNETTLTKYSDVPWGNGNTKSWADEGSNFKLTTAECGYTIDDNNTNPDVNPDVNPDSSTPESGTKKDLDNISDIEYDHTHNISATCIQPYNGKMYMSYHTRGKGQGACIEVFETKDKKTTLLQWLQDKEKALDFNHLMIDKKSDTPQLYVVGNSSKSGGMLARIDINQAGLMDTDVKEIDANTTINPLTVVPLVRNVQKGTAESKYDENCIVRDGDKLLVMSTRGYEVYDPNTLTSLGNKPTAGKSKHIAITGTDMATLHYANEVKDSLEAVDGIIETFNTGDDILTATPKASFNVGSISPNHGKNTIAIDGNYIYVCRSSEGLSCFNRNTGAEEWNWSAPLTSVSKVPQGYANGVTFDDQYIYLACGGYGLVVLDKNNKTSEGKPVVVAKKRATAGNSANYVTLDGGYIYVAYGKSRIQVFQLVDKKVNTGKTDY